MGDNLAHQPSRRAAEDCRDGNRSAQRAPPGGECESTREERNGSDDGNPKTNVGPSNPRDRWRDRPETSQDRGPREHDDCECVRGARFRAEDDSQDGLAEENQGGCQHAGDRDGDREGYGEVGSYPPRRARGAILRDNGVCCHSDAAGDDPQNAGREHGERICADNGRIRGQGREHHHVDLIEERAESVRAGKLDAERHELFEVRLRRNHPAHRERLPTVNEKSRESADRHKE